MTRGAPTTTQQLVQLLQDIQTTCQENPTTHGNYEVLEAVFQGCISDPDNGESLGARFLAALPQLLELALLLPDLFSCAVLPVLEPGLPASLSLTRLKVGCLLVHMFLGTLRKPAWQQWWTDFGVWVHDPAAVTPGSCRHSPQSQIPEEVPCLVYLTILLEYFCQLSSAVTEQQQEHLQQHITISRAVLSAVGACGSGSSSGVAEPSAYGSGGAGAGSTCSSGLMLQPAVNAVDWAASRALLQPVSVCCSELAAVQDECLLQQLLGLSGGVQVVFSNKDVGFGPAGTQEEQVFGCSPELAVLMLCCPTLGPCEAITVTGAALTGLTAGFNRHTRLHCLAAAHPLLQQVQEWSQRQLVFMDALELDCFEPPPQPPQQQLMHAPLPVIPDLFPEHVLRELNKAYCAMAAVAAAGSSSRCRSSSDDAVPVVASGHWGCGAFGANREVKALEQLMAASQVGCQLLFLDIGASSYSSGSRDGISFGDNFKQTVQQLRQHQCTVGQLHCALLELSRLQQGQLEGPTGQASEAAQQQGHTGREACGIIHSHSCIFDVVLCTVGATSTALC